MVKFTDTKVKGTQCPNCHIQKYIPIEEIIVVCNTCGWVYKSVEIKVK